jgi:hypothetical protein
MAIRQLRVVPDDDGQFWRVFEAPRAGGPSIARFDREEDARLFAAADDLLFACQAALSLISDDGRQGGPGWTIKALRKAIAKATAEGGR